MNLIFSFENLFSRKTKQNFLGWKDFDSTAKIVTYFT